MLAHVRKVRESRVSQWLAIGAGGAVGALLRYWVSNAVYLLAGRAFPWGTLVVNVAGSLLMGLLFVLGVINLWWIAVVSAAVLLEKLLPPEACWVPSPPFPPFPWRRSA